MTGKPNNHISVADYLWVASLSQGYKYIQDCVHSSISLFHCCRTLVTCTCRWSSFTVLKLLNWSGTEPNSTKSNDSLTKCAVGH